MSNDEIFLSLSPQTFERPRMGVMAKGKQRFFDIVLLLFIGGLFLHLGLGVGREESWPVSYLKRGQFHTRLFGSGRTLLHNRLCPWLHNQPCRACCWPTFVTAYTFQALAGIRGPRSAIRSKNLKAMLPCDQKKDQPFPLDAGAIASPEMERRAWPGGQHLWTVSTFDVGGLLGCGCLSSFRFVLNKRADYLFNFVDKG